MDERRIPIEIRRFLLENISSIAQWEGLLLLESARDRAWSVQEIARNLYISEQEALPLLVDLELRSLVVSVAARPYPLYRYQPASAELDELMQRAAELYKRALIPITRIIHSKTETKVQQFADAFRIRKD